MKITKSNNMKHMRTIKEGYLKLSSKKASEDEKLIIGFDDIKSKLDTLKFDKSLIDKLNYLGFRNIEKSKYKDINKFNDFVYIKIRKFTEMLLYKNYNINILKGLYYLKEELNLKEIILCAFTEYGRNFNSTFKISKTNQVINFNISDIICKIIKENGITEDANLMINQMSLRLNKRLENVKNSITKSLINNKISFTLEKNEIITVSKRLKWIESFIDVENKKLNFNKINDLEKKYDFEELDKLLQKEILAGNKLNEQNNIFMSVKIKQIISKEHEQNNLHFDKDTEEDLRFYIDEVRSYIEHYFPIKDKKRNNKLRKDKKYDKEYFNYYLNTEIIKQTVKKQIINKLTNMLIKKGKIVYYGKDLSYQNIQFDTKYFEEIKIEEAMRKQFIESTVFANSKLRFFLNLDNTDVDIIGIENKYVENKNYAIKNEKDDIIKKIEYYFDSKQDFMKDNLEKILDSIFCSVSNIRHSIYHYRVKDKILNILNMNEYTSKKGLDFNTDVIKELFETDKENLKNKFINKLTSMNLNLYYKDSILEKIFNKVEFKLNPLNIIGVPSFRNVFKKGINLQKNDCSIACDWYKKDIYDEQAMNTYRNLLLLIYKYMFIPSLNKNDSKLVDCIKKVKQYNMQININNKNAYKYAYKEIPEYNKEKYCNVSQYFNELLSKLVIEENEKNNDKKSEDNNTNKYQRFIQEIYAFAFMEYLEREFGNIKSYILSPKLNNKSNISDTESFKQKFKDNIKISLKKDNYPLMIYVFLKLLDDRQLSKINNQIIKYIACNKKSITKNLEIYEDILELIEFIKVVKPVVNFDEKNIKKLERFVDSNAMELYKQGQNMFVLFSSMEEMIKTEMLDLYKEKFNDYKITKEDVEKYKSYVDKKNDISAIEMLQEAYKKTHEIFVTKEKFNEEELKEYKLKINRINEYKHIKNKVNFVNLKNVYDIHIEVLSRLVGFINDFERDLMFIMLALNEYKIFNNINTGSILEAFKGNIIRNLNKSKFDEIKIILNQIFYFNTNKIDLNKFEIRNTVMHLDDIKINKKIIDTINETRELMSYDRKRKNAVMKSIIDILKKYGICIQFIYNNKKIETEEVKTVRIRHLKKNKNICKNKSFSENILEIDKYDENFIKLIEILFEK